MGNVAGVLKKGLSVLLSASLVVAFAPAVAPVLGPQVASQFQAAADEGDSVAQVGETGYETLAAAVSAATDSSVVTLLDNVNIAETISVANNITLDLNGNVISYSGNGFAISVSEGKTLVINGNQGGIQINKGTTTTTDSEGNETTATVTPNGAIEVGLTATLTVNGGTYKGNTSAGHALFWLADNTGDLPSKAATINLNNVTARSNYSLLTSSYAYWSWANVNVKGGVFTKAGSTSGSGLANEKAFCLVGVNATFEDVKIESYYGPCVEVVGVGDNEIKSSSAKYENATSGTRAVFKGDNDFHTGTISDWGDWNPNTRNTNTWLRTSYPGSAWYNSALAISNDGFATIEGGVYSGCYGLYNFSSGGHPTIKGGTFEGEVAAYKSDMDKTYNTKYGYTSSTLVTIEGGKFVKATSHEENFTSIAGTFTEINTLAIRGGYFDTEPPAANIDTGYAAKQSGDGWVVGYADDTAAIVDGGAGYTTLQAAINAATSGQTVKMVANVEENVVVDTGQNITLDLNGFTLNGKTTKSKAALTNKGTVVVDDSSEDKTGTIKREDVGGSGAYYTVNNSGTNANMTIKSATVENNSGYNGNGASLIHNDGTMVIDNLKYEQKNFIVVKNEETGTLTINDGTYTSRDMYTDDAGTERVICAVQNWGTATINGGTFNGTIGTLWWDRNSTTTIKGGTFTGTVWMDGSNHWKSATTNFTATLNIEGGVFDVKHWKITGVGEDNSDIKVNITGGTFASDPTKVKIHDAAADAATVDYVDTSKYAVLTDGKYVVGDTPGIVNVPSGASYTYNGATRTYAASTSQYTVSGTGAAKNVGNYTFTASLVDKRNCTWSDDTDADKTVSWSIVPAALTAKYTDETLYNGAAPALEVEVTGFVNNETAETADGYTAPTVTAPATLEPGKEYSLTPAGGSATNYSFSYVAGTLKVQSQSLEEAKGSANLALSNAAALGYGSFETSTDGNDVSADEMWVTEEVKSAVADAVTALNTALASTEGTADEQASAIAKATSALNAAIAAFEAGTKAGNLVAAPTQADGTYNGSYQTLVRVGKGCTLSGATATEGGDAAGATNAGTYTVIATLDAGKVWSDGTNAPKTVEYTIGKAQLNAAYAGETLLNGQTPTLRVNVSGFQGSDSASTLDGYAEPKVTLPEDVDVSGADGLVVTLEPAGGEPTANYEFAYTGGTLKIYSKAATDVIKAVDALPSEVTTDEQQQAVEAAKELYDALTSSLIPASEQNSIDSVASTTEGKTIKEVLDAAVEAAADYELSKPVGAEVGAELEDNTGGVAASYSVDTAATGKSEGEVTYEKVTDPKIAKKVTVPATITTADGVTYKVTTIKSKAFSKCTKLTQVAVGSNITTIEKSAFAGAKSLKKVTQGASVTTIGAQAFKNCKKLNKVALGKNLESIGAKAFSGCKKLKTITIKSKNLTSKKSVKNFLKGSKVKTVKLSGLGGKKNAVKKNITKNAGKKVKVK